MLSVWRRWLRRTDRERQAWVRSCAEQRAARAAALGLVNPAEVPRPRRRSPDVVLPPVDTTPRVLHDMPRQH